MILREPMSSQPAISIEVLAHMGPSGELFHTATGTAFADFLIDGHRETWPIRSKRLRSWLRRSYYEATGAAASAAAIGSALDLLEAQAQFDAPERGSISAAPSMPATSTSIWPMKAGVPST